MSDLPVGAKPGRFQRPTRGARERCSRQIPNKEDLVHAHYYLMTDYSLILRRVAALPALIPRQSPLLRFPDNPTIGDRVAHRLARFSLLRWRILVRILVESHIKKRLNRLNVAYIQLRQFAIGTSALGASTNGSLGHFLQEAQAEAKSLEGTLVGWRSFTSVLGVWLPLAAALFYASLGVTNLPEALPRAFDSANDPGPLVLFILALYFLVPFVVAFFYKRSLFVPGKWLVRTWLNPERDTYQAEEILFDLLQVRRPREIPIDAIVWTVLALLFPLLSFGIAISYGPSLATIIFVVLACLLGLYLIRGYYRHLVLVRTR